MPAKIEANGLSDYESARQERIRSNQERMRALQLPQLSSGMHGPDPAPVKRKTSSGTKRPPPLQPETLRRSTRHRRDVSYNEEKHEQQGAHTMVGEAVHLARAEYKPTSDPEQVVASSVDASEGARDEFGRLVFEDQPDFTPTLTPKEVIQAGTWGGCYFHPRGGRPGVISPQGVDVDHEEFPQDWFEGLELDMYRSRRYHVPRNKYKVKAGQDQAAWERSGWITRQDPRGWFQWYCRFYLGRRTADDERQIGRWKGVAGEKGRWKRILVNKWNDATVSPVIRQTLLHWAYELTAADFDRMRRQL